jgi:hypothetical protein
MDEFTVNTPLGQIVVKPSMDSECPGVYIDIRRPGCDCDAPLAMVEYTATEADFEKPVIITRVWDDIRCEEYQTRSVHFGIEEYFESDETSEEVVRNGRNPE